VRTKNSRVADVFAAAEEAARDPKASILLLGETGVGKSHLARHIHEESPRREKPYFEVNCAGLDAQLAESELFGHERGAFTGAQMQKRGIVEAAEGGTLLLDEVAELPAVVQAKLLTFLDDGGFRRLGSVKRLTADVRIIAATNTDLARAVDEGRFRRDLYYRLRVVPIELPPLRQRRDEIGELAVDIVADLARRRGHAPPELAADVRAALERYDWPGNFRELKNVLERALILSRGGRVTLAHLPLEVQAPERGAAGRAGSATRLDDVVKNHIARVLDEVGGNRSRAATLLGIDRATLRRKLDPSGEGNASEGAEA
jgi:transcriptional regulator with PAS, ATPase and Fis domain